MRDEDGVNMLPELLALLAFVVICALLVYAIASPPQYTGRMGDDVRIVVNGLR